MTSCQLALVCHLQAGTCAKTAPRRAKMCQHYCHKGRRIARAHYPEAHTTQAWSLVHGARVPAQVNLSCPTTPGRYFSITNESALGHRFSRSRSLYLDSKGMIGDNPQLWAENATQKHRGMAAPLRPKPRKSLGSLFRSNRSMLDLGALHQADRVDLHPNGSSLLSRPVIIDTTPTLPDLSFSSPGLENHHADSDAAGTRAAIIHKSDTTRIEVRTNGGRREFVRVRVQMTTEETVIDVETMSQGIWRTIPSRQES
jgi:hypothetical protein